jgi:hypothetical protein
VHFPNHAAIPFPFYESGLFTENRCSQKREPSDFVNRDWSLKPFLIHASKTKKGQRSLSALLVYRSLFGWGIVASSFSGWDPISFFI